MKVNKWIVYREINGEYLLLDLRPHSRKYYKYSGTMAEVFTLLRKRDSVDQVVNELCEKYDESARKQIEIDINRIFSKLVSEGILSS